MHPDDHLTARQRCEREVRRLSEALQRPAAQRAGERAVNEAYTALLDITREMDSRVPTGRPRVPAAAWHHGVAVLVRDALEAGAPAADVAEVLATLRRALAASEQGC